MYGNIKHVLAYGIRCPKASFNVDWQRQIFNKLRDTRSHVIS
jgi:hypothetical protein